MPRLVERNASTILGQPLGERLQFGVQGPGKGDIPHAAEVLVEIPFELEHVAKIISPRKPEAAVHLGQNGIVPDSLTEGFRERGRDLRAREVLARDPDRFADQFPSPFEDAIGAFSDVLHGDAG